MKVPDRIKLEFMRLSQKIAFWIKSRREDYLTISAFLNSMKVYGFLVSLPLIILLTWYILLKITPFLYDGLAGIHPVRQQDSIRLTAADKPGIPLKTVENRVKTHEKNFLKYKNLQPYLVVNTTRNEFTLFNRGKIIRSGMCSTGSYILLEAGDEKRWKFETPKGMFRIQGKTESPVWKKPDWAFIEEGLPVPPSHSHLRYEYGVLGDYALSIGDGYLIHGTLYKRLIGMPVTHGCVRMHDEDLEAVFNTLFVGSKVYIF